jgi:curved DNA-binding protein CbpA
MSDVTNYYEILGVTPQATIEEIKAQRYRMLLAYHPDHNKSPSANEMTQRINAGWEILSDPLRRREYDEMLNSEPRANANVSPRYPTPSKHRHPRRRVRDPERQQYRQRSHRRAKPYVSNPADLNRHQQEDHMVVDWKTRFKETLHEAKKVAIIVLKISAVIAVAVIFFLNLMGGGRKRRRRY